MKIETTSVYRLYGINCDVTETGGFKDRIFTIGYFARPSDVTRYLDEHPTLEDEYDFVTYEEVEVVRYDG